MDHDYEDVLSVVRLQVFVSASYDATTHFETTCDDVLGMFERVTGEPFDFTKVKAEIDTVEQ